MCGIAGAVAIERRPVPRLDQLLATMSELVAHRGPDGHGYWKARGDVAGFAHRRLAIIDLSPAGHQPMTAPNGSVITYNGQIYNYLELADELKAGWSFRSRSDTETILAAYDKWGTGCLDHLRGMFAFALWDGHRLFAARDRFGIKPFYYAVVDGVFYFASEHKALLPILPEISTDPVALTEYLTFQYTLGERSLFRHVQVLLPGHALLIENGAVRTFRYWDARYEPDQARSPGELIAQTVDVVRESVALHLRSDVPVGAYLSGGVDSTLVAILASRHAGSAGMAFHGKFTDHPGYDESAFAGIAARDAGLTLHQTEITALDFSDTIEKVIYHLDHPVAGPGSFPQFMTSALAARHVKVVLGGQGGDEIFGGYARYLIAYLEQCIKAAIDGTYKSGNFVVTAESILPNMTVLQEYLPLLRQFFSDGLFGPLDRRYFALIDRSQDMTNEVDWSLLDRASVFARYSEIFNSERNVRAESYFDSMTHFDFKCLLPALLQVEDRMSMAFGLESRVPFLDHKVVELAVTIPAQLKFKDGHLKHLLKTAFAAELPHAVAARRDKMGFPVPLKEWFSGPLREFVQDIFLTQQARHRPYFHSKAILENFDKGERFSRKTWGLLNIELWHQVFHDRAAQYRGRLDTAEPVRVAAQ